MSPVGWISTRLARLGAASDRLTLLRGTAGSFGVKALSNGVLFAAQLLFANYLGVEGFGIYILALAWMNILLLAGRQGFDLATVRFVAGYRAGGNWPELKGFLRASTLIVLAGSITVGLALAATCFFIRPSLGDALYNTLLIVAALVPLFALLQIKAATLRGLGYVVLGDLPHSIAHPLLLVAIAVLGIAALNIQPTPAAAMTAYLISIAISLAIVWWTMRRKFPAEMPSAKPVFKWREWILTAPAMTLIAGFGIVLNQIGAILLGVLATPADAGIFGASTRVAWTLQLVVFALVSALAPMAARLHASRDMHGLQRAIGTTGRTVFVLCLVGMLLLLLIGEWILGWFGDEFRTGYGVMAILLVGQLAWAANAPAGVILNMTGRHNASALMLGGAVIFDITLSILLIPSMGATGAAIANAATLVLWNIVTAAGTYRWLGIRSWVWFNDRRPNTAVAG